MATARPDIEFVPVWIDNIRRVMPKGEFLPVPLLCSVTFGEPLAVRPGQDKDAFLSRGTRRHAGAAARPECRMSLPPKRRPCSWAWAACWPSRPRSAMARLARRRQAHALVQNLNQRIFAWWVMVA
jgi:hypothetical protein